MERRGPHSPPSEMVFEAISFLKEKDGSSFKAIKKYIATNYNIDVGKAGSHIKKFLKVAVKDGYLIQTKGKIGEANGVFKLCTVKKEKSKSSASANKKRKSKKRVTNEEKKAVVKKRKSPKKKVKSSGSKTKLNNNNKIELKKIKTESSAVKNEKTVTENRVSKKKTKKNKKTPASKSREPTIKKQEIKESKNGKNTLKANEKSRTKAATSARNNVTSKQENFVKRNQRNKPAVVKNKTKPADLRKNLSRNVQNVAVDKNIKTSKVTLGDFLITIEAKVHHIQPNSSKKKTSKTRRQRLNKQNKKKV